MTQREFESRVKGAPRTSAKPVAGARGRVAATHLLEVALVLFCAAFAIELISDGGRLIAMRKMPAAVESATAAFGAAPMHAARGVLAKSRAAAGSALTLGAKSGGDETFAQAWDRAIATLRTVVGDAPQSDLSAEVRELGDRIIAMAQTAIDRLAALIPSSSDAGASVIGLDSDLPMLAGMAAFAALVALCFSGAVFMTVRIVRGARHSSFRY